MKLNYFFLTLLTALFFISCNEDDLIVEYVTMIEKVTVETTTIVEVDSYADSTLSGNTTTNTTLDPNKIYLLKGRVSVTDGVTLPN
jgi:hypothetical protein